MQIPKSIKIGGLVYTVEMTENMCSDHSAEIDYMKVAIKVRPDMDSQKQKRDFIHEIVHGIFDNLGLCNQDEKEVDELAGAFYALIVDNPELFGGDND